MTRPLTFLVAATVFALTACDGEKVEAAKKEGAEAAVATGEAAREVAAKGLERAKHLGQVAGTKLKAATEAAKEALSAEKGGPALENFKAKMGGLSEWFRNARGQAGNDPGKAHGMMGEMMNRVNGISPEGLPPDLKTAFQRYQGAMARVQEVSRTMPADAAGAEVWYRDNADRLAAVEKEVMASFKALKEAAAHHGLTNLDLGGE